MTMTMVDADRISPAQARRLTERIRQGANQLYNLVLEAYERGAWRALGYPGWRAYVDAEFDMSPGHATRLLMQARAVRVLTAATELSPEDIDVSTRAAAELGPAGVAEVAEQVRRVPLVERAAALREAIIARRQPPESPEFVKRHTARAGQVEQVLGTDGAPEFVLQEAVGSLRQLLDHDAVAVARAYAYFLPDVDEQQNVAVRLVDWAGDFAEELGVTY
jgi:hypothetical protein